MLSSSLLWLTFVRFRVTLKVEKAERIRQNLARGIKIRVDDALKFLSKEEKKNGKN